MADSDPVMENPFSAITSSQPAQLSHHGKLLQDIVECIADMKLEYEDSGYPLTDDSKCLQKFCVKLEYFFQVGQKVKTGLLGGKKDYWNFILDCLSSNKSLNDGIRFVKSIPELKTNLGKGRALLRFALIHQRLADTLQQCALNAKIISDWYHPKALWPQKNLVSDLINALYDLNELQFDLSPRGYDLDTSWPTFARRTFGSPQSWKPPSRTTSITSLSSITPLEVNVQASPSPSPYSAIDPEVLRLQHNLTTAEYKTQEVSQQLDTLENEKMAAELSVEELNKNISEKEQQLKEKEKQCSDLQVQNEKLGNELKLKEETWAERESILKANISTAEKKLDESAADSKQLSNISFDSLEMAGQMLASQKRNEALQIEVKSAELKVESTERVDVQKSRLIELLDKKIDQLQGRNERLMTMVEQAIGDKEGLAKKLKEATHSITDLAARLLDSEKLNKELRTSNVAFKEMLHSMEDKGTKIAKVAKEKLVQYSQENKSLKAEIASKGEEATSVSSEIKKTEELSAVMSQLEAMNKRLGGLESLSHEGQGSEVMVALKSAENLNLEIRSQVEKLQDDLKAKEGLMECERSEQKARIGSLERERDELKQAVVAAKSEGGPTYSVDPNSLKRVLEEKKKVLVNAQAEASSLRKALAAKIAAKAEADAAEGGSKAPEGGSADQVSKEGDGSSA